MTRMSGGDSVLATTRVPQESSPLFAQCPWGWMMAGTRFSSTCLTSHAELMAPTTLKPSESRSMPTAEFAEYTSPTDYTLKMNYLQNSNFTSLCNRRNSEISFLKSSLSSFVYTFRSFTKIIVSKYKRFLYCRK